MQSPEKNQKIFFDDKLSFFARLGVAILGGLFLLIAVSRLVYPFDTGNWEAFNWMSAQFILEGKNPYAYAFTPPYSMSAYGIVYYALLAVGVKFFGFQLWWGRILTILAFAVFIWAIAKITKKLTQSDTAVWVACLAGLAMYPLQYLIAVGRGTDLIAAPFACVALWLAFMLEEKSKISFGRVVAIVLLSAAAFFTKQTFLLPSAIIFLRFLQLKKWREALWLASAFVILVSAGIFLLNYTSSGGYLWQHFTHAQRLPRNVADSVFLLTVMLRTPAFLLFVVFLFVFGYRRREFFYKLNRDKLTNVLRSPKWLLLLYFLLSLGWTFVSTGRLGANVNYYFENSFVAMIIYALIFADFRRNGAPRLALAMIVLLTLGGVFQMTRVLRGEYFRWQTLSYHREVFAKVAELTPPNSVCVSVYPEMAVWNGCPFNFGDFEEYSEGWSPELREIFERELKAGRYATILWYDDNLQSKFPNYRLIPMSQSPPDRFFPVYLYVRTTETP